MPLSLFSLLAATSQFRVSIGQKMQLTGWENANNMRMRSARAHKLQWSGPIFHSSIVSQSWTANICMAGLNHRAGCEQNFPISGCRMSVQNRSTWEALRRNENIYFVHLHWIRLAKDALCMSRSLAWAEMFIIKFYINLTFKCKWHWHSSSFLKQCSYVFLSSPPFLLIYLYCKLQQN